MDLPARDLTIEAAQVIGLGKTLKAGSSSKTIPFAKLKALLDSRSDRDIIDGLRKVVGMIYMNKPCLPYFSSVVKNVANPNIEVKKLVYIYLVHYAESDPDLALLSVKAFTPCILETFSHHRFSRRECRCSLQWREECCFVPRHQYCSFGRFVH